MFSNTPYLWPVSDKKTLFVNNILVSPSVSYRNFLHYCYRRAAKGGIFFEFGSLILPDSSHNGTIFGKPS